MFRALGFGLQGGHSGVYRDVGFVGQILKSPNDQSRGCSTDCCNRLCHVCEVSQFSGIGGTVVSSKENISSYA